MACETCPYQRVAGYMECTPKQHQVGGLVVIGSAPSAAECKNNEAFSGYSGKILWKALEKAGLPKGYPVYGTHVIACSPMPHAQPTNGGVNSCKLRLKEELEYAKPKVILLMGSFAVNLFQSMYKITDMEGKAHTVANEWLGNDVTVVYSMLPEYILRNPHEYHQFRETLNYVVELCKGAPIRSPGDTKFQVIRNMQELRESFEILRNYSPLSCDIETVGFNPREEGTYIISAAVAYEPNKVFVYPKEAIKYLKTLLEDASYDWIYQNGQFDTKWFRSVGIQADVYEDTMLQHYALDETKRTHGLDKLSRRFLGASNYKQEMRQYITDLSKAPKEKLYRYNAEDADCTLQLHGYFQARLDADPDLSRLYRQLLVPASNLLRDIESHGIWVNLDAIDELHDDCEFGISEYDVQIRDAIKDVWNPMLYYFSRHPEEFEKIGTKYKPSKKALRETEKLKDFNPDSPSQFTWLIYKRLRAKPAQGYKPNTKAATLVNLECDDATRNIVKLVVARRGLKKVFGTFVNGIAERIEVDGRVHTSYMLHGTVTGRLASEKPNMQNIPRSEVVRSIFQAPPGYLLLEADYAGAELRWLAVQSGDKELERIFIEGRDLHDEVAKAMYGDSFTKDQRVRAKAVNFGIPYGRSAFTLALEYKLSLDEAQSIIDAWLARFPVAAAFITSIRDGVGRGQIFISPSGRKRRFGLITKDKLHDIENEAVNYQCQAPASDATLLAGIHLQPDLKEHRVDAHIVNLVHDSILLEVLADEHHINQSVERMRYWMQRTPSLLCQRELSVPFEIDFKIGKAWGRLEKLKDSLAMTA